jgi:tetratricopeptide (TPR) repeat protein
MEWSGMVNRRIWAFLTISILILAACSSSKSAKEYVQDGRNYLESGERSKAIAALEEAIKREPELAEAHRLLGEALRDSGRWPEAVAEFKAYKTLASEDGAAYFLLGWAYAQTGDSKEAAATFAEGVDVDPSFLDSYQEEIAEVAEDILRDGREALAAGDLATANELLTIVASLVPDRGEVYFALGQAHLQADDMIQALAAFANAVSLSPELATEHAEEIAALAQRGLERGQAALDAGDLDTAAQIIGAVTALQPNEANAFFLMGNIYNQANLFVQAIEQYQTVLKLEPDSSSAHTNMGVVYYKMGDLEMAIQEYDAALRIEPDDAETHYLMGAAYVQMDQLEQGMTEFIAALTLDDQLAPAYVGLGNVYLLQGDLELALDALEQATALSPNSPEAFFALGQVYIQLGNVAEARSALERVLSLNPDPRWREQAERLLESLNSP